MLLVLHALNNNTTMWKSGIAIGGFLECPDACIVAVHTEIVNLKPSSSDN